MLKDVAGIRLCGANFDTSTDIMLLEPNGNTSKNVKGALLFGHNGAGKSTLAKAVKKVKGQIQETINSADFLDVNKSVLNLTEEEKARVFVFDEEYVDKNVKFRESGLDTIIMLGQQAELAQKIQEAKKDLEKAKQEYEEQETVLHEYENAECEKSPKYHMNRIRMALQGDDCWAGRDKTIKGNRTNTGVRDETFKQFIHLSTDKTRDQLIIEYNDNLKALRAAQKGDASISSIVPTFSLNYDERTVAELLLTKINKPKLTEREKYLLDLIQSGKTDHLNNMVNIFSDKSVCMCPTCLQTVSNEYKNGLVLSIQKVLSKAVEEHQESLRGFIKPEIVIDFSDFTKLGNKVEVCSNLLQNINVVLRNNNKIIQSKIDNPYTPCSQKIEPLSELIEQFMDALSELEDERVEYNKAITATRPLIEQLTSINNLIAYYDIQEPYQKYLECEAQQKIEIEKHVKNEEVYYKAKKLVDELEAKAKNVKVALSIINCNLSYIFFSNNRIRIEYSDGNYVLLSNGKRVKPSQISQGERNIIGLCYFFASILQNQEESSAYSNEYLIVIDDPVSSFDIENKTGIMSFLRYQLGKYLLGNKNTRVVIFTHDLLTYYDFNKVFIELIEAFKGKYKEKNAIHNYFELKNKDLFTFPFNSRQEYSEITKIIYNFALGNSSGYELVIGNIMRQMLEAFSTFQYRKGIAEVSTDHSILALLPEEVYRNYFENLMYRLILNNGSHRLEQTQSTTDMNFFTVISDSEKQRTAKEILCFVYLLNKKHLLSHLDGCTNVENNLNKWCSEIKRRVGA